VPTRGHVREPRLWHGARVIRRQGFCVSVDLIAWRTVLFGAIAEFAPATAPQSDCPWTASGGLHPSFGIPHPARAAVTAPRSTPWQQADNIHRRVWPGARRRPSHAGTIQPPSHPAIHRRFDGTSDSIGVGRGQPIVQCDRLGEADQQSSLPGNAEFPARFLRDVEHHFMMQADGFRRAAARDPAIADFTAVPGKEKLVGPCRPAMTDCRSNNRAVRCNMVSRFAPNP